MNLNAIPFVGWILSAVFSISLSIPFWFCWTVCGIGSRYFQFIPTHYQVISFWNCVGLFIVISILKSALTPKLVDVTQTVKDKVMKERP